MTVWMPPEWVGGSGSPASPPPGRATPRRCRPARPEPDARAAGAGRTPAVLLVLAAACAGLVRSGSGRVGVLGRGGYVAVAHRPGIRLDRAAGCHARDASGGLGGCGHARPDRIGAGSGRVAATAAAAGAAGAAAAVRGRGQPRAASRCSSRRSGGRSGSGAGPRPRAGRRTLRRRRPRRTGRASPPMDPPSGTGIPRRPAAGGLIAGWNRPEPVEAPRLSGDALGVVRPGVRPGSRRPEGSSSAEPARGPSAPRAGPRAPRRERATGRAAVGGPPGGRGADRAVPRRDGVPLGGAGSGSRLPPGPLFRRCCRRSAGCRPGRSSAGGALPRRRGTGAVAGQSPAACRPGGGARPFVARPDPALTERVLPPVADGPPAGGRAGG